MTEQPPATPEVLLREVLADARDRGLLGPGPLEAHVQHADGMAAAVRSAAPGGPSRLIDLGSGAGIPGLVLALRWPAATVVLLDAGARRAAWLVEAVDRLGLSGRCEVAHGRAEDLARTALRATFDLVTARGFAPPPVTAECAAGFLAPGGWLAVAEPPDPAPQRWPARPLEALGLRVVARSVDPSICLLQRTGPLSDAVPRRTGLPAKRPLWALPAG